MRREYKIPLIMSGKGLIFPEKQVPIDFWGDKNTCFFREKSIIVKD